MSKEGIRSCNMSCTGFEEGFYSTDSGKIIYLSRTTEGFVAESRTGSTFKVYETTLKGWCAIKIDPETYFQDVEANRLFIKSKLEQLAQSEQKPQTPVSSSPSPSRMDAMDDYIPRPAPWMRTEEGEAGPAPLPGE